MNEKLVKTLSGTIQKSVNRFNLLENCFDQKQWSFLPTINILDNKGS